MKLEMAELVVFYSRADENYFGDLLKNIKIGNTEKVAGMIAGITGAENFICSRMEAVWNM